MFKVIWLMKRKKGITHEQFREHYERSHVMLAHKYFGHLWTRYRRNYVKSTFGSGSPAPGGGMGPIEWGYDCIAEWVFPNEENYKELFRIAADPIIGKEFFEDEGKFLDRKELILAEVEVVDTGTGDGHGTLSLTRKIGESAP